MKRNIDNIKIIGNDYFKESLIEEEEIPFEYSMSQIEIGTDSRTGRIFSIDMKDAIRGLLVGKAGSGKTFLLRTIIDRAEKSGYNIFIPTDIKDEFKSSKEPLQYKFRKNLLPQETPEGKKIFTFRPTFFREEFPHLAENNHWISVDLSKMKRADFMTLMNSERLSESQKTMLELLYDELKTYENFEIDMIEDVIDDMNDFTTTQKTGMKLKFKPILSSGFSDPKYLRNVPEIMRHSRIVSINMENFESFGKGNYLYPEVFVGLMLRNLIVERRKDASMKRKDCNKLNPLFIVVDEAPRFIPANGNPSCKNDFLESVDIDRRYGISYLFAAQYPKSLPDRILKQCRYIFIPHNADTDIIKDILIMCGMVTRGYIQNAGNDANRLKRQLGKWQWLVIDTTLNTTNIINVAAPLSNHMETSK